MQLNKFDKHIRHKIGHQTAQEDHQYRVQSKLFADKTKAYNRRHGVQYIENYAERNVKAKVMGADFLNQHGNAVKSAGDQLARLNKGVNIESHQRSPQNYEGQTPRRQPN
jgi:ribose 5-phosphate isomerase